MASEGLITLVACQVFFAEKLDRQQIQLLPYRGRPRSKGERDPLGEVPSRHRPSNCAITHPSRRPAQAGIRLRHNHFIARHFVAMIDPLPRSLAAAILDMAR